MYYVMFYGGIICAIISVAYAIYVFVKKDVPGCVSDVKHKRNLLFAGTLSAPIPSPIPHGASFMYFFIVC